MYVRFRVRDHNGIDCSLRHDRIFEQKQNPGLTGSPVANTSRLRSKNESQGRPPPLETLGFIPYKQR